MTRVPVRRLAGTPPEEFPDAAAEQINNIINVVETGIEFGDPQNPFDPSSASLAGATGAGHHNGTTANISGSWVEVEITSAGIADVTFTHNLNIGDAQYTVPVAGEPNVRWLFANWMHDGTNQDGTTDLVGNVTFQGGTVAVNAIDLRVNTTAVGTALTIDGDHPVRLCLFFTRATRGQ